MSLLRYEDMAQTIANQQQRAEQVPVMKCRKCGSSFFEVVRFAQFRDETTIVFGQEPPMIPSSTIFCFLRCVCGEMYEPGIQRVFSETKLNKTYDELIGLMEKYHK